MSDWYTPVDLKKIVYNPAIVPEGRQFRNALFEEVVAARNEFPALDPRLDAIVVPVVPVVTKTGSSTFPSGGTTFTVTDAFFTATTYPLVSPTQPKIGSWSVASAAGSFTITSDSIETATVTFDWAGVK